MLQQFNLFAHYNRLINQRIMRAAGLLDEDQLKQDRGQATTLLSRSGIDFGDTDLLKIIAEQD